MIGPFKKSNCPVLHIRLDEWFKNPTEASCNDSALKLHSCVVIRNSKYIGNKHKHHSNIYTLLIMLLDYP